METLAHFLYIDSSKNFLGVFGIPRVLSLLLEVVPRIYRTTSCSVGSAPRSSPFMSGILLVPRRRSWLVKSPVP